MGIETIIITLILNKKPIISNQNSFFEPISTKTAQQLMYEKKKNEEERKKKEIEQKETRFKENKLRKEIMEMYQDYEREIKKWHEFMKTPDEKARIINKKTLETELIVSNKTPEDEEKRKKLYEEAKKKDLEKYERWITIRGRKKRVEKALSKWTKYGRIIIKALKEEGIPEEYSVTPLIESLMEFPTSWAGAKGPWQIIKPLGKKYLKINSYVDERNNYYFSSKAAAKHLKALIKMYEHPAIALTAYIRGPIGTAQDIEEMLNIKEKKEGLFKKYSEMLKFHESTDYRILSYQEFINKYSQYNKKARINKKSQEEKINLYTKYLKEATGKKIITFKEFKEKNNHKTTKEAWQYYKLYLASQNEEKTIITGTTINEQTKQINKKNNEGIITSIREYYDLEKELTKKPEIIKKIYEQYSKRSKKPKKPEEAFNKENIMRTIYYNLHEHLKNNTKNDFSTPNYPIRFIAYYLALNHPEEYGFKYEEKKPVTITIKETKKWYDTTRIPRKEDLNKHIKKQKIPPETKYLVIKTR